MADEPTQAEQIAKLTVDIDLLTKQLDLFKAQVALDDAKQLHVAQSTKAILDALQAQTASQSALNQAQAQLPFAELLGINAATTQLPFPKGKEGTVKIEPGKDGTALLRSKEPMLELLGKVADKLKEVCKWNTVLLKEEQLVDAYAAQFTFERIQAETAKLNEMTKATAPTGSPFESVLAPIIAGAYSIGFAIDTVNSLLKIFRTDRRLDVFDASVEATQMLSYVLEAKFPTFIANPALLSDKAIVVADSLLEALKNLGKEIQVANDMLAKIKQLSEEIAQAPAGASVKNMKLPSDELVSALKAEIAEATLLLDAFHPSKNPDKFWTQVRGQFLAQNIEGKQRLFIEAMAQTVQVTDEKMLFSDHIFATGEVQVAYRLLNPDGSRRASGVILMASEAKDVKIDKLEDVDWEI